ncbi:MAG: AAA family ATPase, partial [bacterium]|nr:AAA family ATPase [bacterium]
MLRDLHIRNLAVLEEASIEFGQGFNVLSGETGAGKSIVVDSLALLSGVRASSDLIRTGAESLTVTGFFDPDPAAHRLLGEVGLEGDGEELVIRREVTRSGRNRVFLNDRPVTLKLVAELAPALIRIHGQREELGLVAPELQRTWLDLSGG